MATDFGTRFMPEMARSRFDGERWSDVAFVASDSLPLHPAAHVLHYASTCFEGLKAFRHADGGVRIFRLDQNVARFAQSSELLYLPAIDAAHTSGMIVEAVRRFAAEVPEPPASMYIRPTHIGTEAAIGKAAAPSLTSLQYVLLSPVGDYFGGSEMSLRLLIETQNMRCGTDHGRVKGGGNYASALKHIMRAQREHRADQVLFCPAGDVQETGAANFILLHDNCIMTKPLDDTFLHGVTRGSLLRLAADNGMQVEERDFTADELIELAASPGCEAGLSGTAAVLTSVGTLIRDGREYPVGDGKPGPLIRHLRKQLNDIQWGVTEDHYDWLTTL